MRRGKYLILCAVFSMAALLGGCGETVDPQTLLPEQDGTGSPAAVITPSEDVDAALPPSEGGNGEVDEPTPSEPFVPDILDKDGDVIEGNYDFSTVYDYTGATLTYMNGEMSFSNGVYTVEHTRSFWANTDSQTPFPYGTLSADVVGKGGDVGIVFGLSQSGINTWEGNGISYYFYFVSTSGLAYLGKTDNGSWSALKTVEIANFDANTSYELKVIYKGNKMLCFVDGELSFTYADLDPLSGTGWGIRSDMVDSTIANVSVSSAFLT